MIVSIIHQPTRLNKALLSPNTESTMRRLIASLVLFAFLVAFIAICPKPAHGQSMPTPAVTRGVVAAATRATAQQPSRVILVDGIPAIEMDGQRQLLVTATPEATILWRTSGHALTDILSRLTQVSCDENEVAWQVDGRTVLCTEPSRRGLTDAQAAVEELRRIRVMTEGHPFMSDPIAAALAPRAIALVSIVEYAQRHHGRAPRPARAKRAHRHH